MGDEPKTRIEQAYQLLVLEVEELKNRSHQASQQIKLLHQAWADRPRLVKELPHASVDERRIWGDRNLPALEEDALASVYRVSDTLKKIGSTLEFWMKYTQELEARLEKAKALVAGWEAKKPRKKAKTA